VFGTDQGLLLAAAEARRATASAQSRELQALAEYARRHPDDEFAHLEVAPLLHISDRAAYHRMRFALELVDRLPATLDVLRDGRIEEFKAQLITDAVRYLSDEQALTVEDSVLEKAAEQTPAQLRAALARAVLMVDPEGAEYRRQAKKAERHVSSRATEDGEAFLAIYHSAAKIAAMRAAIRGQAMQLKNAGGELRNLAQLEADVAVDLIFGSPDHHKVEVHLTMPIGPGGLPAEVNGVGPITPKAARELAAEATTWRWLRTDPDTGAVIDMTAASYRPPAALAEFITTRDRTCRHPGCVRPASGCDIDHLVSWPQGQTCDTNCACLCRRHHRAKHQAGWRVEQAKPGFLQWTSPLGFVHLVEPTPVTQSQPPPGPDPPF
jgi:uncharacterized protein DUF222